MLWVLIVLPLLVVLCYFSIPATSRKNFVRSFRSPVSFQPADYVRHESPETLAALLAKDNEHKKLHAGVYFQGFGAMVFFVAACLLAAYCAIVALEACGVPVGIVSDVVLPSSGSQGLQAGADSVQSRFDSALLKQGLDAAEIDQRWHWLHRSVPVAFLAGILVLAGAIHFYFRWMRAAGLASRPNP